MWPFTSFSYLILFVSNWRIWKRMHLWWAKSQFMAEIHYILARWSTRLSDYHQRAPMTNFWGQHGADSKQDNSLWASIHGCFCTIITVHFLPPSLSFGSSSSSTSAHFCYGIRKPKHQHSLQHIFGSFRPKKEETGMYYKGDCLPFFCFEDKKIALLGLFVWYVHIFFKEYFVKGEQLIYIHLLHYSCFPSPYLSVWIYINGSM